MPGQSFGLGAIPDKQVGEYDLIEEIARGGMGVVYKAKHRNLNRISAIKMVLGGRFSSAEELQRFQVEAESAAKLDHPAIIPIYEIGECDGQAYFAMKYVEGGSLADKSTSFRNKPQEAVELLLKVAEAVHHAHQRGVLHRDLKPANILLDHANEPYVTDLGLAKSTTGGSDLTHTGAVLGTPSYMPPEQAAGKAVTTGADIYSLGAIMYELLVGRPPYQGETSVNVLMRVLDSPPEPPSKVFAGVDRDLELVCLKCLEREPENRYLSAQAMANDLRSWLAGDAISVKPPSFRAVMANWMKQNKKLVYGVFAIVVGALVCAPFVFAFLSDELASAYDSFPAEDRPLLFSFSLPGWMATLVTVVLFLVIWPSIGLLNAVISKPSSVVRALTSGLGTSAVLSLIFYVLVGWTIILKGAQLYTNDNLRVMTEALWPSDGSSPEQAMEKANQLFGGLEQIPENERSEIVSRRMNAERYASAPFSFLAVVGAAFAFSIPIIYGTLVGSVLLKRNNPTWLFLLRYGIAWCTMPVLFFSTLMLVVYNIDPDGPPLQLSTVLVMLAMAVLTLFLVLRKWRRPAD